MTTVTAACEYLCNLHELELRYHTSSHAFTEPVLTFLRHFSTELEMRKSA